MSKESEPRAPAVLSGSLRTDRVGLESAQPLAEARPPPTRFEPGSGCGLTWSQQGQEGTFPADLPRPATGSDLLPTLRPCARSFGTTTGSPGSDSH